MARQAASIKKTRTRYSQEYKAEALALADRVGTSAAARKLGLQPSQLYQWRAKAQQQQSASAREQALADENARLKRQLADKSEELESQKKPRPDRRPERCQEPEVKYTFIHQHHQTFSIQRMCMVLGVARSGYYAWRQRGGEPSPRRRQQAALDQLVAHGRGAQVPPGWPWTWLTMAWR